MANYKVTVKYNFQDSAGNPAEIFVYYFPISNTESEAKEKIIELLGNNSNLREIPYNGEIYNIPTNTAIIIGAQEVVKPS
jgi:hypothetical protein